MQVHCECIALQVHCWMVGVARRCGRLRGVGRWGVLPLCVRENG